MKLEAFFEKFEIFAEAPDAVARMRELVRHLAITGRLVSQNCDDEPASNLLRRIEREMSAEQRHRQGAPLAPFLAESQQYELPENWTWARFRDVAIIASNLVQPSAFLDFIHLAPDNIEKGNGVLLPCRTVREDKVISANHRFYAGQIVYSKIRPNLAKVVVVDFEGLCSADMYPIDALIDAYYLQLYMLSESFLVQAVKTDTRVAMPKINQTELNAIAVPVPPLAEQKRIVAKVDELMALCDRLEAQQQERETRHAALARASLSRFAEAPTPSNLNVLFHKSYDIAPADLRKSILTLAVQGKLVSQDPNDKSAEEVIRRIPPQPRPARYAKRSNANIQGIAALSVGPTECDIPAGWACVPLIQVARLESGHTPSRSRPDWWGGDVSWVGVVDARLHNGKTIFETLQHTNEEGLANSAARMLPAGTVCVSRTASVGYVTILGKSMATSQDFVNWVPSEAVTSEWLQLIFTSEKDAFNRFSKGAVHQTIYYPEWLSMHAMVPPLAEQRRIVAKVEQLMALVDLLETQLAVSRATAANLLSAVVTELTAA